MGRYDWYVEADVYLSGHTDYDDYTIECYFVNNGWNYQTYMTAYVDLQIDSNPEDIVEVMSRRNVDTTGVSQSGGRVYLGSHTYRVYRGSSNKYIKLWAGVLLDGGYADGKKWSSTQYRTTGSIHTVSYNLNGGGSGAPSSQKKIWGAVLTLSSTTPTRTGYEFVSWNTSSDGTGTTYYPGSQYGEDVDVTMYAVWNQVKWPVTYNANGGSGAPESQEKVYNVNLTLSSVTPTRTGYNFLGWGTSASATTVAYASGATYSTNEALSLYAIWQIKTWTVSYNANGGSNPPSSQTKTYNQDLTLSSTIPTKELYIFQGWGLSSDTNSVSYLAGSTYSDNKGIILYAVWKLDYKLPILTVDESYRVNSSNVASDDGTKGKIVFSYSAYTSGSYYANNKIVNVVISYKESSASSWTVSETFNPNNASGTLTKYIANLSTEKQYDIKIEATDSLGPSGSNVADTSTYISTAFFTMDFLAGGHGIAFGGPSQQEGFVCNMKAVFNDELKQNGHDVIPPNGSTGQVLAKKTNASNDVEWINRYPQNGSTGQVLAKKTNSNNDVEWVTVIPTGTITVFAGSSAPNGWLLCNGSAISRTTYSALFSVIGTTYGTGNGSTTFNLPNLQGRFPLGKNTSHALASTGGSETITLTTNQIPAHTHGNKSLTGWAKMWGDTGFIGRGGSADWGGIIKPGDYWYGNAPAEDNSGWQSSSLEINASHEHDSVGGGESHDNMPPYLTMNYIIKT